MLTGTILVLWAATAGPAGADGTPTITAVNPAGPALAGTTVFVDATGFAAGAAVTFTWDDVASGDPASTADSSGNLTGQDLTVPLTLQPGPHQLEACSPAPTCSPPFTVQIGPVVSTPPGQEAQRGQPITITVQGLQANRTPLYGWNGAFAPGDPPAVPDTPSFDIVTTVPADAPADSVFGVCQEDQQAPGSGVCADGTDGKLAIAVTGTAPRPPASSPPPGTTGSTAGAPSTTDGSASAPTSGHPKHSSMRHAKPRHRSSAGLAPHRSMGGSVIAAAPAPRLPTTARPIAASPAAALLSPTATVHLLVAGFVLLTLVAGGMLRGIAGLAVPGLTGAPVATPLGGGGPGSARPRSWSWRWPGTARLDRISLLLPIRVGRLSPLLARVLIDSSYLRAMLGSVALLFPALGVVLGVLATGTTHGHALPPTVGLLTALAVLGVLDAFAGFLGAAVFVVGVIASGGVDSAAAARTMLGLAVVWFAVPLVAGAARPLRRLPADTSARRRQRLGDFVIAALIGFWVVQKMISALPGLAERQLPVARDATAIALVVLGASVLRLALEGAAGRWYPARLAQVQPSAVPVPGVGQRLVAAALRTAVLVFVAFAFTGNHWQLWAAGVLFLAAQVLGSYADKLPSSEWMHRWLPRIVTTVAMVLVGTALGALALRPEPHSGQAALNALVLLAAASLALSVLSVFSREGRESDEGWGRWLAGAGVLGVGVLFVLAFLS